MRKDHSQLFRVVNQHAHALSRAAYEATRNALRARALQLIREGAPQDQVIQAIEKATIQQILKP